jgi:hypothetical protein
METYRNPDTGKFLPNEKPHNAGLKKYHDPQTGQVIYVGSNPGEPWLPGGGKQIPPNHKGSSWFHNSLTGEKKRFTQDPGTPWVKGRGKTGTRTTNGMRWFFNPDLNEEKLFYATPEPPWVEGRGPFAPPGWREKSSRVTCRIWGCDCVYVLKVTTKEGLTFGKWGSSRESTFNFREKEFGRKGFTVEIVRWGFFGESTEDAEAILGRILSKYPVEVPRFYGYTETFEWSEKTQQLLKEIWNGLEENPAP